MINTVQPKKRLAKAVVAPIDAPSDTPSIADTALTQPSQPSGIIAVEGGSSIDSDNPTTSEEPAHDFSSHVGTANALIATHYPGGLFFVAGGLWTLRDGQNVAVSGQELKRNLAHLLGNTGTASLIKQIVKYLEIDCVVTDAERQPKAGHIYFSNGVYDIQANELLPVANSRWIYGAIPHPYEVPHEPPSLFLNFLNGIFSGDYDIEQKIALIQQWMGYLLIADTSQQKMLVLFGSGANGKSVLCDVITHMLGTDNVSHAMLDRLGNAAVRSGLEGKLLNVSPDLSVRIIIDGYLKAVISGDKIDVERKYQDPYTITPHIRLMVSTNTLPPSQDTSEGFFRRLIILIFNNKFGDADQDHCLKGALIQEIPKVIPWALEGLKQLLAQGQFTIPPSSIAALSGYRQDLDPIRQFAAECVASTPDAKGWRVVDIYAVYSEWSKAHGIAKVSSITLGKRLTQLGFNSRKSNTMFWLVGLTSEAERYCPKPWPGPAATPALPVATVPFLAEQASVIAVEEILVEGMAQ